MASRAKKENAILLPSRDKLLIGKIRDINKLMSMVSAEYGMEEDMAYFTIEKEKPVNVFKLQYIPRGVSDIHSSNAKKFMVYDLVKNSHSCVMKIDKELNKKALSINDLLNTIDHKSKETITSKLDSMFEIPGELDYLLDQMLTDPQYNSFKYTVLDSSKTSCLLCVNSYGLFVRSLETPYDVIRQLSWQDIMTIKTKANKLIFRKKNGESEEIACINKKMVISAHCHLVKYLAFIDRRESGENKRAKIGWFGSFASRIRQSFSRRTRTHDSEPTTSAHSAPNKSTSSHYRENAPPNSTVPGSSVVSEDCLDNVGSMMEPSIKTNSTHDVSLGSASSFRPGTSSLVRVSGHDDHVSVKTTSTYEVNLDAISTQRAPSCGSKGDHDSLGPIQARKSPPLSQLKDSVFSETTESVDHDDNDDNKAAPATDSPDAAVPPPMRTCEIRSSVEPSVHYPQFSAVRPSHPPPPQPPIRSEIQETQLQHDCDPGNDGTIETRVAIIEDQSCLVVTQSPASNVPEEAHTNLEPQILIESTIESVTLAATEAQLPSDQTESGVSVISQRKSIPSPKIQRPNRIPSLSSPTEPSSPDKAPSPSDKENYNSAIDKNGTAHLYTDSDDTHDANVRNVNFSRFENEEYTVDSKTTFTSVSTTGDSITKKFTKTEISSLKASGIPAPKQYKTTTTITSTVKKSSDGSKSPIVGAALSKTSGIPRMASK